MDYHCVKFWGMNYRRLGRSDLMISEVGFGTMSMKADAADAAMLVDEAMNFGINFFDTADLYEKGLNEEMLGRLFKGRRDKIILATKVGNQWREDGSGWDWNPRKDYILACVEKSLTRLQTDYIDLYQLHGGTIEDPISETIEAFELLKTQGKIRHYGISSIRPNVIREYVTRSSIVSVMLQYSLLDRRPEEEILALLKDSDIGVLARGTLGQGILAGKPPKEYLGYTIDEVSRMQQVILELSNQLSLVPIQFVLKEDEITSAVTGIRTMEQLRQAVRAVESGPLENHKYDRLKLLLPPNLYGQHR